MGISGFDIADAELGLLQVLWQRGRATARELTVATYGDTTVSQIATVQKLLQRLEAKRLVRRDRSAHVHTFSATVTQAAFAGGQLARMADKLTDGSLVPFLTHLVEARKLSKAERDELRRILDEGPAKKRGGKS